MDLVLNNLHGLICHKTQTTNQPASQIVPHVTKILQNFWLTQPIEDIEEKCI